MKILKVSAFPQTPLTNFPFLSISWKLSLGAPFTQSRVGCGATIPLGPYCYLYLLDSSFNLPIILTQFWYLISLIVLPNYPFLKLSN